MMNTRQAIQAGLPAHETVYRQLRDMLLFGDLAPGQAVTIQGLTDLLQVGMTPVREALRRLTAEGALTFLGNRRITVPVLSLSALDQLIVARRALEPELARRACDIMSGDGIAELREIDARLDAAIGQNDLHGYLRCNHAFHQALYARAEAEILVSVVNGLWLRFGPSLRGVLSTLGPQETPDMHKALLVALQDGRPDDAAEAIRADVTQGMNRLRTGLTD